MRTFLFYVGCGLLGGLLSMIGYPVTEKPVEFFAMIILGAIVLYSLLIKDKN